MNQSIRRKLKHITDILWAGGVTNPVTYIEQISYLIFLKLLDEEESERELRERLIGEGNGNGRLLFPKQASRYRWSKWKFKSGPELRDFVRDEVFPYMASMVRDAPRVAEYFRDSVLEIVDPAVLKQVVDELDTIEFKKLGPDVKGDVFEYLLTHLGQSALNGQFRTPRQIRAFMVAMTDPDLGDTIERLQAYQEAGADVLYAPGLMNIDDIRTLIAAVDLPVNVLLMPGGPTIPELFEAGTIRVSTGSAISMAAQSAIVDAAKELLDSGTQNFWMKALGNAATVSEALSTDS